MESSTQKEKLWTGKFTIVLIIGLVFFLSLQLLTAGFPAYITEIKNNPSQGGLMTTVFMIFAIITRPIIGFVLPKVNMKKMNIVTLIILSVLVGLSYNQSSVGILLFLRALHGICFGILSTSIATMATNAMPASRLGEGVGYYGMSTSGGTAFAPMIAIAILQGFSYNTLIIVSVALIIITLVLTFLIKNTNQEVDIEKAKESEIDTAAVEKISFKEYAFDKNALLPCFLVLFFSLSLGGVTSFLEPLGSLANLGGTTSLFFLVEGIVLIISKALAGVIYDRYGHRTIIYLSSISGIIGLYLLSSVNSTPQLLVAGFFYGIAYGFLTPVLQTLAVESVNKKKQGTANAMYLSFMDLGMALGSYFLGLLAGQMGYRFIYSFSILFLVLLIIIYTFTYGKQHKLAHEVQ